MNSETGECFFWRFSFWQLINRQLRAESVFLDFVFMCVNCVCVCQRQSKFFWFSSFSLQPSEVSVGGWRGCGDSHLLALYRFVIDDVLILPDNHRGYADRQRKYVFILLSGRFTASWCSNAQLGLGNGWPEECTGGVVGHGDEVRPTLKETEIWCFMLTNVCQIGPQNVEATLFTSECIAHMAITRSHNNINY